MSKLLRVLIVEDSEADGEILRLELQRCGYDLIYRQVQTEAAMHEALLREPWDIVISDFCMPQFDAEAALRVLQDTNLDLPFIIVSGTIGEETAVEAMRRGADDFMTKGKLSRLGPAIDRELREANGRRERRVVEQTLAETRARAQFALEAAGVGTWESDLSTGATRWSATLERLHGLPEGGFAGTFESFIGLIDSEDRQRVRDQIARLDREGGDTHLEYRVRWPDGSIHWIAGIGRTIGDEKGQSVRAAGIGLDISSRKQLEEQFHQAQKMEAIGRLAGGVAHDFNNLLTSIIGYSEFLLDRVADQPDLASDVEEIKKAGERASRLTKQLLAFSRKQTIMPRVLDLNQVVGDLERMLRRVIGEDVALAITPATALGRTKADPSQVEQVLMNLAVNARDAMPAGGKIQIRTANAVLDAAFAQQHVGAVPGRYIALAVADSGVGMKPEIVARIFEPFFTTKPVGKGTGLGLSTVYGIVKQNSGYVTVESTPGVGTTFTIYWPEVDEPVDGLVRESTPTRTLAGTETVLLAEDEASVRELVRKILEKYGYRVLPARDGAEALDIEARYTGRLDLLLTDIVMPGLNGPELAQRLVRRRPSMHVIYMSGFAHHLAAGLGSVSRRTSFIQKPFSAETLANALRDCLERGTPLAQGAEQP